MTRLAGDVPVVVGLLLLAHTSLRRLLGRGGGGFFLARRTTFASDCFLFHLLLKKIDKENMEARIQTNRHGIRCSTAKHNSSPRG